MLNNQFLQSEPSSTMTSVETEDTLEVTRSRSSNHHNLHAHFKEEDGVLDAHDSVISIEQRGNNLMNIRLGFLVVKHIYEIKFSVVDELGEDVTFNPLENLNVKIQSANPSEDGQGHDIVLEFSAMKEKLMQESVTLQSSKDESKMLVLVLFARVLGKGKGTPALKKGIHLLRVEVDEDSEASDWQGF